MTREILQGSVYSELLSSIRSQEEGLAVKMHALVVKKREILGNEHKIDPETSKTSLKTLHEFSAISCSSTRNKSFCLSLSNEDGRKFEEITKEEREESY